MFHCRKDYNRRIQDSENLIPADEPVFLLRGQEPLGHQFTRLYADAADKLGCTSEFVQAVRMQSNRMYQWHGKLLVPKHAPDAPAPELILPGNDTPIPKPTTQKCPMGDHLVFLTPNGTIVAHYGDGEDPNRCPASNTKY